MTEIGVHRRLSRAPVSESVRVRKRRDVSRVRSGHP
jgi:hypothetical protein